MKRKRKSSSSSFLPDLIIQHTIFSIWGMNQIRIPVLKRLKQVWNMARITGNVFAKSVALGVAAVGS